MIYVISKAGKPLMSTERYGKVRRFLKQGFAKVVKRGMWY
nr:RRXRR domain-containing protein [Caldicoprobacter faecalis]